MRLEFISIVSCAILLAWTSDVSGQAANEVRALNIQALQLNQKGQFVQALELAVKALRLSSGILGPEHLVTAECLNSLGEIFYSLGVALSKPGIVGNIFDRIEREGVRGVCSS